MLGAEVCAFGAPRRTPTIFGIAHFKHTPYKVSKNTVAGMVDAEVCAFGEPRQNPTIFGFVHSKHTHTRYPKTLLLAYLVQRYVRLGRHLKNPQFLALCISNTPILGIQKHCRWSIWCRDARVWGATSNPHNFRHCPFQTHPY